MRITTFFKVWIVLSLLLVGVAWMVPAGRSSLSRLAIAPDSRFFSIARTPAVRAAALRHLAADPTEENLLILVRIVNTADPVSSREVLEAAVAELQALAGGEAVAEGDAVGAINRWAARRLGRPLDAHDGVMGWYPVEGGRYRQALDTMAGDDLEAAAAAWDGFGIGDFANPEEFLWAAGPGLADRRPLRFVLRVGNSGLEAVPEPREAYAGPVQAETVGEAVALVFAGYEGVNGPRFLDELWKWWEGYARAHHLPPGGPAAR